MTNSSTLFLEHTLSQMGMNKAVDALLLMREEMCSEKGYSRHNGDHYYYHLVDVTWFLLNMGVTYEPCIISAILHDYQEDVEGVTKKMIEALFGEEVALYVDILSKKDDIDYKIKENMDEYLLIIGSTLWTAMIKTADNMHNVSSLKDASLEKRLRQAIQSETFFIPFFKAMRIKYPRKAPFFIYAKSHMLPSIEFIKLNQAAIDLYQAEIEKLKEELADVNFMLEGLQK